ncbi:protease inhibitor Inh/omp19 family protein [Xanthobacter sp. DSM 24535]|uniref:protease inhibitor Inh/omp19 family protein n=1 Tax=Roseixanthobacter psychrophilus TaxID=3119917 RepID=UPI00372CCFF4
MRRLRLACALALAAPALTLAPFPTAAQTQTDILAQTGPSTSKPAPARPAPPPKPSAAKPEPAKTDPALRAQAEQAAGTFVLTSADGERKCPLTLKTDPAAPAFSLVFDGMACAGIGFMQQVTAWTPDSSGSIRMLNAQGRLVVEFDQATAGNYEALREGDGVYFLASPTSTDESNVRVEDMLGAWDLARTAGAPICHVTFLEDPVPGGGRGLRLGTPCDAAITQFGPVSWSIEGGNVLMASGSGTPLRFARQEDGNWAKVPERGRPLLLLRQ